MLSVLILEQQSKVRHSQKTLHIKVRFGKKFNWNVINSPATLNGRI